MNKTFEYEQRSVKNMRIIRLYEYIKLYYEYLLIYSMFIHKMIHMFLFTILECTGNIPLNVVQIITYLIVNLKFE